MEELYSNADDCLELAKIIKKKLGRKIEFYGSVHQEVVSGKFHCQPFSSYESYQEFKKDELSFAYKYLDDVFLRITISDAIYKRSIGQKLAALSDFYEVLREHFGTPTLFYTIKDDDENSINIQWSFKNKDEDIESFKNGTAFDDAEIDTLIIINDSKIQISGFNLNETTREMISKQVGLPFELLPLVDANIEDFVRYKYGKKIILTHTNNNADIHLNVPEEISKPKGPTLSRVPLKHTPSNNQ